MMLGIRMDEELDSALERVARSQSASKSAIVRQAIRQYLSRYDPLWREEIARQLALVAEIVPDKAAEDDAWFAIAAACDDEAAQA